MSTNNNPSAILQGIEKQLDVKALTSLPEVSKKFLGVKVDLSITGTRGVNHYQKFCKYVGEQSKIITDAVMQLRTTKLLMKADKENIESSEYKRYKAIIDAKLIARAKEVKDLAAVAQKKAAEFQEIHRVFAKRYEANKDQEIGVFQKNTGLTGFDKNQAKQLIDVLFWETPPRLFDHGGCAAGKGQSNRILREGGPRSPAGGGSQARGSGVDVEETASVSVGAIGLEPPRPLRELEPKSGASANFATPARCYSHDNALPRR